MGVCEDSTKWECVYVGCGGERWGAVGSVVRSLRPELTEEFRILRRARRSIRSCSLAAGGRPPAGINRRRESALIEEGRG